MGHIYLNIASNNGVHFQTAKFTGVQWQIIGDQQIIR
jgi:hypothetical protein